MSDYQSLVCDPCFRIDPWVLLRTCGLLSWHFDHLVDQTGIFEPFTRYRARAWQLQLGPGGYAAYRQWVDARSRWRRDGEAKMRRLARDVGPLRFEAHTTEIEPYVQLTHWKSAQYRRTGLVDNFSIPWVREFLGRLRWAQRRGCQGMLSALYAGERLVAVHLGMRSEQVWHHYLPSYDRALAPYSPGLVLLLKMIEAAPGLGLAMIDFSKGDMDYKLALATGSIEVAAGCLAPWPIRALQDGSTWAERTLRRSGGVRRVARWSRRRGVALANAWRQAVQG